MTDPDDSVPVATPPSRDLAALAMKAQVAAAIFGEDAAPVKVGRYEILDTLGVGGMGVVYAAWDESLGRRVALKLLPSEDMGSDRERARLAREAQALARLSHPNVVTVYEVGEHDRSVFVAMELIEGLSLQKWQQQRVRARRELVEVYLQAGRGLAAAHRAGLVHRDFKPANVLVGNDGRVRVVDFGLAQGPGLAAPTTSGTGRQLSAPPVSPVTRTGALVGTPAYMAPEQLAGAEADARADQFSFCVALYEALVGCRPYEVAVLRMASERKVPPPTKGSRRLPLLLRRALLRGLAIEPQRRWADMEALLRAIEADAAWRRRAWGVSGPVVLGLGVAWLAGREGSQTWEPPADDPACEAPRHGPAVEWSARRQGIEQAFMATGKPYRDKVWSLVDRKLGEHAQQWSDAHVAACGSGDDPVRSQQLMACLDRQAMRFDAVLRQLQDVDADSIVNAGAVADALIPVEACLDPVAAPAEGSTPTIAAELLLALDEATVSVALGKYAEIKPELEALRDAQPADAPLRAEILLLLGEVQARLEHYDSAEASLVEAQAIAGDDELRARAVLAQINLFLALEESKTVHLLSRLLEELVGHLRLERPSPSYPDYLDAWGRIQGATQPKEAQRLHRRALDERLALGRSMDDLDVTATMLLLANALADDGELTKARETYATVQQSLERTVGDQHPEYARVLFNLGLLSREEGDLEAALELFRRARRLESAAYGPESTQAARAEVVEAEATFFEHDDHARGLALAEHAWKVQAAKLPPGHSDRVAALRVLAKIEFNLGNHSRSLELHRLLVEEAGTDDAPDVLHNIAWLKCQVGECDDARRFVDQALTQVEARLLSERMTDEEILRLYVLHTSALVALAEGEPEKARVLLADVLREAPRFDGTEELVAEATQNLKRARRRR